MDGKKMVRKC